MIELLKFVAIYVGTGLALYYLCDFIDYLDEKFG